MSEPRELPRAYDLPPKWDGDPIEWDGWEAPPPVLICPPPKPQPCHACGRFGDRLVNHGTITFIHVTQLRPGQRSQRRITAYRCPHCAFDQVWDQEKLWNLDWTDYGDEGSYE